MSKRTYTVVVPEEFEELLEALRRHYHLASKSEVIRIALGIMKVAMEKGGTIVLEPNHHTETDRNET